jgi:hypothetical protein
MSKLLHIIKTKLTRKSKKTESITEIKEYNECININEDIQITFKKYLTETMDKHGIIDLNEKENMPENLNELEISELTNLAFYLIQHDQLDAKLIGDLIIR